MAIKVLIKRQIKQGRMQDASRLLIKARYNAMGREGYISSETMSGCQNSNLIMVASMWQQLENWDAWRSSDTRKEIESLFEEIIDGPTQYEAYTLGLQT